MTKAVIFTVESDSQVLQIIEQALNHRYSDQFRVMVADSGESGLKILQRLLDQKEVVALILAYEQLSDKSGTDFFERASEIFPDSKRVLAVAPGSDVLRRMGAHGSIDTYLVRSSEPPSEHLYPLLDDLLAAWQVTQPGGLAPEYGIRVVGHRWSPQTHEVRDFLARNQLSMEWLDIESNPEAQHLREEVRKSHPADTSRARLPLVFFPDGSLIEYATVDAIAQKIGLSKEPSRPFYDLIIVGGGPAGLSTAVYAASEGLRTVLVEKVAPGGQAGTSSRIENYLGFPSGLSGSELARRAVTQAQRFGVEILAPQTVTQVMVNGTYRSVRLQDGTEIGGRVVVLAMGVQWRKLNVPGIDSLIGAGVYYGATMAEAQTCLNQEVYIVGGANSAGQAAVYFARSATHVIMLIRGESIAEKMSQDLVEQIEMTPNITVRAHTQVVGVQGESHLESITIENCDTHERETLPTSWLYVFVGANPKTDWLASVIERDERGYILSGTDLPFDHQKPAGWPLERAPMMFETSIPGVFAVGDVSHGSVKRVASAVGQGAVVVQLIHKYLETV